MHPSSVMVRILYSPGLDVSDGRSLFRSEVAGNVLLHKVRETEQSII